MERSPRYDREPRAAKPPIVWAPFVDGPEIVPDAQLALMERAFRAQPENPLLATAYGCALVDRFAFDQAVEPLSAAVAGQPAGVLPRLRLAQCQVRRRDFAAAGATLAFDAGNAPPAARAEICRLRGVVRSALGDTAAAEAELKLALQADPAHAPALQRLARIMAGDGRDPQLLTLCDQLVEAGVRHSRLIAVRASTLARLGRLREAADLVDFNRIICSAMDVPSHLPSPDAFNAALAEALLAHPFAVNRENDRIYSGQRVRHLLRGPGEALIRTLASGVRARMDDYVAAIAPESADLWAQARPRAARLDCWALVHRGNDHARWHVHPNAWLSAVYYVATPPGASAKGDGPGCLEFGPPPEAGGRLDALVPTRRIEPAPGLLVLAPGHLHHRTIPTGTDEPRICVAFDLTQNPRMSDPRSGLSWA